MIPLRLKARVLSTALAFIVTVRPLPVVGQDDPLRHGHALIIGTWAYSDPHWPRLDDIKLQIQLLASGLTPHFDSVQLMQNPGFEELESGLPRFLRMYGNIATAYAGHGYTETDYTRNSHRGFITGTDTPSVDGSDQSYDAARVKAISMEAVRAMVSDINAKQVLFLFDSCFYGTVFNFRSPTAVTTLSGADVEKLAGLPVREFITAGDTNEMIPAHSPIPELLLNAISGAADTYHSGVFTATAGCPVPLVPNAQLG